ncbi:MAG: sensor histidine kinase, partial [Clostridia bacterium]|nr:sensor histidine kinase [Clostridia bacterium]
LTADQKRARLSVMNTGEAISEEEAQHVFDRFYRTDGARKNEDNNSFGLGLSIAQATVNAHGGTIECRGVENKGTVFTVLLPLAKNKKKHSA